MNSDDAFEEFKAHNEGSLIQNMRTQSGSDT